MREYEELNSGTEVVYEIVKYDKELVGYTLRDNLTAIWYILSLLVSGLVLGIFITGMLAIGIPLIGIVFTFWCLSIILKILVIDVPTSIIREIKQLIRRK